MMINTADDRSVSNIDWSIRVDLAACYRLVARFGWDQLIFSHISARVQGAHHILLNPYGLLFSQITASSLVKVDLDGNVAGHSDYEVNPAAPALHTPWYGKKYRSRCTPESEIGCVIHLETDAGAAVSAQEDGLLPISQTALGIMPLVAYHDFEGFALDLDERERLMETAGSSNRVIILRNHGTLVMGPTVGATFQLCSLVEQACRAQLLAQSGGAQLIVPSSDVRQRTGQQEAAEIGCNERAWPALLRTLDEEDPSYKT